MIIIIMSLCCPLDWISMYSVNFSHQSHTIHVIIKKLDAKKPVNFVAMSTHPKYCHVLYRSILVQQICTGIMKIIHEVHEKKCKKQTKSEKNKIENNNRNTKKCN